MIGGLEDFKLLFSQMFQLHDMSLCVKIVQ